MKKVNWKTLDIKPHHIVIAWTSMPDYEMSRLILLQMDYSTYIVLEGSHCSCYDFDDTEWDAMEYNEDDLKKLAGIKVKEEWEAQKFWKQVVDYL